MSEAPAISVRNVRHLYQQRAALDGLDLQIPAGRIFAILGPNGGGKTTLFRLLSTLLPLREGEISILGQNLRTNPAEVRRSMGVVFQHPALDKKLRVRENLRCGGHLFGLRGAELDRRITEMAGRLELADRLSDFVETLSGGLQRRVEIAKALLPRPALLLLDEPSTGLDPGARRTCWQIYRQLQSEGMTIVLTTHLLEEAENADEVAIIHRGRVVACGSPAALASELGPAILVARGPDPAALAALAGTLDPAARIRVTGDEVRISGVEAAALASQLHAKAGGLVQSITIAAPGLDDVFAQRTGTTLAQAEEEPTA
jgi:ABC-2 type transport system ATP-binding protein